MNKEYKMLIYLKKYLDPVRDYFATNEEANKLREEVKKFSIKT